jgi:SAM-dependent methyltransferase
MNESHLEFYRRWHQLAQPYFEWQFQQFKPFIGSRVADIGCGPGNLTGFLLDRELYIGVDLDQGLLQELHNEFGKNGNIEILKSDILLTECRDFLKNKNLNSILCLNLIEHIENDVQAISNMIHSLPQGGYLCLLVPAMPNIYGTLDSLDGHFRRYTKKLLRQKLKGLPVEIIKLYYFNSIGALGWWWKGKIKKETTQSNENYILMNKIIPYLSPLESLITPPLGLSLIAIVKRI